jgi:perosamine synthetase
MRMGYLAPAGTPIPVSLYASALTQGLFAGPVAERLAGALARHSGHTQAALVSTGRAAMVLALEAMREAAQDRHRDQVIVAGYTCYSVPASVLRAGLRPRLCDVDPRTLSLDLQHLRRFDLSRVLCIVTANLYGLPNALDEIASIARAARVYLLDDAAQALGATYGSRPVGGHGDVGLYSFDKGKNITSLEGGALVSSEARLSQIIARRVAELPGSSALRTSTTLAKLGVYSLLLRPALYGLVQKMPFLGLGRTVYEDDFPLARYSAALAPVAYRLLERLPELTRIRAANAAALARAVAGVEGIEVIDPLPSAVPGYTRLPLRVLDRARRARLIAALDAAGVGATASYPQALADVPELQSQLLDVDREQPGARAVAASILTLPVHPYCPPGYGQRIGEIVRATR